MRFPDYPDYPSWLNSRMWDEGHAWDHRARFTLSRVREAPLRRPSPQPVRKTSVSSRLVPTRGRAFPLVYRPQQTGPSAGNARLRIPGVSADSSAHTAVALFGEAVRLYDQTIPICGNRF
jgi:hypothetical protein